MPMSTSIVIAGILEQIKILMTQKVLITFLDNELRSANDDYNSARKYSLKAPEIKIVSPTVFYSYMAKIKKLGSQNKMPRVLNKKQAKTWLDFINAF